MPEELTRQRRGRVRGFHILCLGSLGPHPGSTGEDQCPSALTRRLLEHFLPVRAKTFTLTETGDLKQEVSRYSLPRLTVSLSPVTIAEKGPGEGTLGVQTIRAAWSHARGRMMAVNAVVLLRAGPVSILLR